jgi:hypothetical protein
MDTHDQVIDVDGGAPLHDVVVGVLGRNYLAMTAGGEATWVVRAGRQGEALGVVAQRWTAPRLLSPEAGIATVGHELHFDYQAQNDPQAMLAGLRA